jgi:hypothetical protein
MNSPAAFFLCLRALCGRPSTWALEFAEKRFIAISAPKGAAEKERTCGTPEGVP